MSILDEISIPKDIPTLKVLNQFFFPSIHISDFLVFLDLKNVILGDSKELDLAQYFEKYHLGEYRQDFILPENSCAQKIAVNIWGLFLNLKNGLGR